MRHTAAHVLAAASKQLKPETRLGVGPTIENGFYHDIDVDERYSEADLARLQATMHEIQKKDLPIEQREISKSEARKLFAHDPFKLELIDEIDGDTVGISDMGKGFFVTLCRGGHAPSTGHLGAFKMTSISSVYWKGDASRPQLQRIYGVLFTTQKELVEHLATLEEAKKRDHRKLGRELDLFTFSPLVGPGLPLFTPRGTMLRRELEQFLQSLQVPRGYQPVFIPHITKADLYATSGHLDKFKNDLFYVKGKGHEEFVMKPMNCPHHTQIYASRPRSYRDLPLRFSEITTCYRDEQPGELQGLSRVRAFTQDDGHVFCRADQIEDEINRAYSIITDFYAAFNFELSTRLSLRDPEHAEQYLGSDELWQKAEVTLRRVLQQKKVTFVEKAGEAAFYGPKIDFLAKDSLGRIWQLATIQLDFNMPERFQLTYTDSEGKEQRPVMLHRAILGSVERFMAILIEHYAGAFPLWLAPTQVVVMPISDDQADYARQAVQALQQARVRAELDDRSESIGKKIRDGELQKVPVMLVVGKKEVAENTVSVRRRGQKQSTSHALTDVITTLKQEITSKA